VLEKCGHDQLGGVCIGFGGGPPFGGVYIDVFLDFLLSDHLYTSSFVLLSMSYSSLFTLNIYLIIATFYRSEIQKKNPMSTIK